MSLDNTFLEPTPMKSFLALIISAIGVNLSTADFLGSVTLALFGAALGAIWIEHVSIRERVLTVFAGLFGALLVVIGHDLFLSSWSVQLKSLIAGLVGRYAVAFMLQGANQVVGKSAGIINRYLNKIGESNE